MRETRKSGSEGGGADTRPSLPLSHFRRFPNTLILFRFYLHRLQINREGET